MPARRRTRDRTADPVAGAPAGPRAALGAPRGAASDQEARAADGAARERACRPRSRRSWCAATCGNIDTQNPCTVCTDPRRDRVGDRGGGGCRRPLGAGAGAGRSTRAIMCSAARCRRSTASARATSPSMRWSSRAHDPAVKEVILALNATVDGQTTAHYITDLLRDADVKVTRLAHGVPVGGELDYLDEGTLVGGDPAADGVLDLFSLMPAEAGMPVRHLQDLGRPLPRGRAELNRPPPLTVGFRSARNARAPAARRAARSSAARPARSARRMPASRSTARRSRRPTTDRCGRRPTAR